MRISASELALVCLSLLVGMLVIGSVLGQPLLLSFVTSDSMEPTIDAGDGFVAIPRPVAGPIETGDVVVYRAKHLHGGGLTTHRVVDETAEGYITRGDANPSTDQAGPEPPVKDAQIVATALQNDGRVVVIPHLGTLITGVQDGFGMAAQSFAWLPGVTGRQALALMLLAVTGIIYGWDVWRERSTTTRERTRARETGLDSRIIVLVFVGLVVVAATAAMVGPSGPTEYGFVSSGHDTPGAGVIGVGETEHTGYRVHNPGVLPVVSFLETEGEGLTVESSEVAVSPADSVTTTVTLTAPSQTGYYRRFVIEHRYLALLPQATLRTLYRIHPLVPIVAIDALIAIPFYLIGSSLAGTGRIRPRSRRRKIPLAKRLKRVVRKRY
jgi:signal peptidase